MMKVQTKPRVDSVQGEIVESVEGIQLQENLLNEKAERAPVLLAARALQSLARTSEGAFSRASMVCYYRIMREIFMADSPDWSVGGARAGNGGESSAYITSQCVRAIRGFIDTMKATGTFFKKTYETYERKRVIESLPSGVDEWKKREINRVGLSWHTSTHARLGPIALRLGEVRQCDPPFGSNSLNQHLGDLARSLEERIEKIQSELVKAVDEIKDAWPEEKDIPLAHDIRRKAAHEIALGMVEEAVTRSEDVKTLCSTPDETLNRLDELGRIFFKISEQVERSLAPTTRFISTVLDRELAAASSSDNPHWDARELAFAAAAYGSTGNWQDNRLRRACTLLAGAMSEDGVFPLGRPYHSSPDGSRLHTVGYEVCECLSYLLEHVDVSLEPTLVQRMLQFFLRNKETRPKNDLDKCYGWHFEHPPIPPRPTLWATALAVMALDRTGRMLDKKINDRVLRHFSFKTPTAGGGALDLDKLIYPDFGRPQITKQLKLGEHEERDTVAMMLERMKAHILSIDDPDEKNFSRILYGPPGTGKTTLLEALACSCEVPLVEISPSDIAVQGQEAIESRARAIFKALSMLTRAVIIFDEFEPVLLRRDLEPGQSTTREAPSMFTFLTPSMLPKLTHLHEAAKNHRVVYCLVTNHIEKLDEAAIREGRFDGRIGIYHPDLLSRAGALCANDAKDAPEETGQRSGEDVTVLSRLLMSTGMSIQRFAKLVRKGGGRPDLSEIKKYTQDSAERPNSYGDRLIAWEYSLWKENRREGGLCLPRMPSPATAPSSKLIEELELLIQEHMNR